MRVALVAALTAACATGELRKASVLVGEAHYDEFFRHVNALRADVDDKRVPLDEARLRARGLAAEDLTLLESVDRDFTERAKIDRVRRALEEARQWLVGL